MNLSVFTAPGRFFRGNLHTHSNVSDGVLDLAEVFRRYKAEGYDFLALTDHFAGRYDYPMPAPSPRRTRWRSATTAARSAATGPRVRPSPISSFQRAGG